METISADRATQKTAFGHPAPLFNVVGVEMWERFSFYGMQAILAFYMYYTIKGGLGMPESTAVGLVGAYGGSVYLSSIIGAWLADRVLGSERVLFYAGMVVICGHIALAFIPGGTGLAIGLVLVALGSGGLKTNATAIVGSLYDEKDLRRDAGFSIFYMFFNFGALVGPLITGWLMSNVGFHAGFGAAAIGMALGITQYAIFRRNLPAKTKAAPNPLPAAARKKYAFIALGIIVALTLMTMAGLFTPENLKWWVVGAVCLATVVYFWIILSSPKVTATEKSRVYSFIPLFIASAAFWSLYQQQFTVVPLYTDKRLNLDLFGFSVPPAWVQSINPVFIVLLGGVAAALWTRLGKRQPSTPTKFALGLGLMGVAFLLFLPLSPMASVPLIAMVGILFVFTIAELLISPIGLSVATKLAPANFQTQVVALFFLSVSLGSTMSGVLAEYYAMESEVPYFLVIGGVAVLLGLALLAAAKPIKKLMAGVP